VGSEDEVQEFEKLGMSAGSKMLKVESEVEEWLVPPFVAS
jgi:hypothetical protein